MLLNLKFVLIVANFLLLCPGRPQHLPQFLDKSLPILKPDNLHEFADIAIVSSILAFASLQYFPYFSGDMVLTIGLSDLGTMVLFDQFHFVDNRDDL